MTVKLQKPNIHSRKSKCCGAEVRYTSVDNGWTYYQCQECLNSCGIDEIAMPHFSFPFKKDDNKNVIVDRDGKRLCLLYNWYKRYDFEYSINETELEEIRNHSHGSQRKFDRLDDRAGD